MPLGRYFNGAWKHQKGIWILLTASHKWTTELPNSTGQEVLFSHHGIYFYVLCALHKVGLGQCHNLLIEIQSTCILGLCYSEWTPKCLYQYLYTASNAARWETIIAHSKCSERIQFAVWAPFCRPSAVALPVAKSGNSCSAVSKPDCFTYPNIPVLFNLWTVFHYVHGALQSVVHKRR